VDVGIGEEGIKVGGQTRRSAVTLGDDDIDKRAEGEVEGEVDGDLEGRVEGDIDGDFDGDREGEVDGDVEGDNEGEVEGARKMSSTRAYPV
jgi:hypothetical protein